MVLMPYLPFLPDIATTCHALNRGRAAALLRTNKAFRL